MNKIATDAESLPYSRRLSRRHLVYYATLPLPYWRSENPLGSITVRKGLTLLSFLER